MKEPCFRCYQRGSMYAQECVAGFCAASVLDTYDLRRTQKLDYGTRFYKRLTNNIEHKKDSTMRFLELLRKANEARQNEVFAHCKDWTSGQHACAIVGEVGELCNLIKKVFRGDTAVATEDVAHEMADVFIYADLLAKKHGVVFVANVFDRTMTTNPAEFLSAPELVLRLAASAGSICAVITSEHGTGCFAHIDTHLNTMVRTLVELSHALNIDLPSAIVEKFNYVSFLRRSAVFITQTSDLLPDQERAIVIAVSALSERITTAFGNLAVLIGEDDALANVLLAAAGIASRLKDPANEEEFATMAFTAHESMQEAAKHIEAEKEALKNAN